MSNLLEAGYMGYLASSKRERIVKNQEEMKLALNKIAEQISERAGIKCEIEHFLHYWNCPDTGENVDERIKIYVNGVYVKTDLIFELHQLKSKGEITFNLDEKIKICKFEVPKFAMDRNGRIYPFGTSQFEKELKSYKEIKWIKGAVYIKEHPFPNEIYVPKNGDRPPFEYNINENKLYDRKEEIVGLILKTNSPFGFEYLYKDEVENLLKEERENYQRNWEHLNSICQSQLYTKTK